MLGVFIFALKAWGKVSTENKVLKRTVEAAKNRKQIDHEVQKLTPAELAVRLRGRM